MSEYKKTQLLTGFSAEELQKEIEQLKAKGWTFEGEPIEVTTIVYAQNMSKIESYEPDLMQLAQQAKSRLY